MPKLPEVLPQEVMICQVKYPSQIISSEDQANIRRCPIKASFGHNIAIIPLSFDGTKGMFHYGLPSAVSCLVPLHPFAILFQ